MAIAFCLTVLLPQPAIAQTRFHMAGLSTVDLTEAHHASVIQFKTGISTWLFDVGEKGAAYSIVFGKFGEAGEIDGGGGDFIWFPVKPLLGPRIFLSLGPDVSAVDFANAPAVTYFQAALGGGLYWDFKPSIAGWIAGRAGTAFNGKYETIDFGAGMSINL